MSLYSVMMDIFNIQIVAGLQRGILERLVMAKHQIDCVYCFIEKVKINTLSDGRVRV